MFIHNRDLRIISLDSLSFPESKYVICNMTVCSDMTESKQE